MTSLENIGLRSVSCGCSSFWSCASSEFLVWGSRNVVVPP